MEGIEFAGIPRGPGSLQSDGHIQTLHVHQNLQNVNVCLG